MNPIRIAIIGTHRIGKTTLIQRIKERVGPELLTPPELASEVLEWLKMDWRKADVFQVQAFQNMLYNYTRLVAMQPGPLLADRTTLDVLAYCSYQNPTNTWPDYAIRNALHGVDNYDHIYFYRAIHLTEEQLAIQTLLKRVCEVLPINTTPIEFTRSDAHRIVEEIVAKYQEES